MVYDEDCDLIKSKQELNCRVCYRHDICKEWFSKHPEEISCADDLKHLLDIESLRG